MALKATVRKVQLSISDMNRGYYQDHGMTLAQQPSETDLRLLIRLAVFALNAGETLAFTKGLADVEEPDLWDVDLTGRVLHWIDLGQPTEKRIRQSCSKAPRVSIYTYQKSGAGIWYQGLADQLERFRHLQVVHLTVPDEAAAASLVERTMSLSCVIEDDQVLLSSDTQSLPLSVETAKAPDWA
jgi:uncharacterized protein YaeQ